MKFARRAAQVSLFIVLGLLPTAHAADDATWQATLDRVVPAVVALRVTATRDFETEDANSTVGTGFVIDAKNGWILTNRHMVHAGPVVADALFQNSEEIDLKAVYRDPVHDFGFYRFDPTKVKHMQLAELALDPKAARVGLDIRVVGNDAGEKISILDGTLARIDRNAPSYGRTNYNDFNTFYLQAASNTSGGSSGSPVVDLEGKVVALNAGGSTRAASSFYLPLDRVVRAFEYVRQGKPVPRGTVQTTFRHRTFDELVRLGLPPALETEMRAVRKGLVGGLVVERVGPAGPADGVLLPGDILLEVAGEWVVDFVSLESKLDDAVGNALPARIQRGGRTLEVELPVQDLHQITPDEYFEVGRAVLTPVSYQSARNFNIPIQGVYVSVNGYSLATAGIPEGSVIVGVDGVATPTLDELQTALQKHSDGDRVTLRFFTIDDAARAYEAVVVLDRKWFEMQRCKRDDSTGRWPCVASPPPPPKQEPPRPTGLVLPKLGKPASLVAGSLVRVDFDVPHPTAGVKDLNYVGIGVVVDKAKGLILVDRDTVPVRLGDLNLTFAGAIRVPGEVVFLHPTHNFGLVHYDPAELGDTPVQQVELLDAYLKKGDSVWLVGMDRAQSTVSVRTTIEAIDPLELGVSNTPRFRDSNIEVYSLEKAESTLGGVITDKKGRVAATWSSFVDQADDNRRFKGLPAPVVLSAVRAYRANRDHQVRILGAELEQLTLEAARDRGVSDARIRQLLADDPTRRTLFEVARTHGLAPAHATLRDTDIVLELNGELFRSLDELDRLGPTVSLTIVRERVEQTVEFKSYQPSTRGVDRVVSWAGMSVHEPHFEVAAQKGMDPDGVYVAWLWFGSPGARYNLRPTRRILAIGDTPTPDLNAFISAVKDLKDRQAVRISLESLNGKRSVATLEMDLEYWPTQLFEVVDGTWTRRRL